MTQRLRRTFLAATALALILPATTLVMTGVSQTAVADGGAGGASPTTGGSTPGAGGTGFVGNPGGNGINNTGDLYGSGGGGGGAGGGKGGDGSAGSNPAPPGAAGGPGGTAGTPNGADGSNASGLAGAGGGGGGWNGNGSGDQFIANNGTLAGGNGGNGGNAPQGGGGGGGAGGYGAVVLGPTTSGSIGTITGGNGGNGGTGGSGLGGQGGDGGIGAFFNAIGALFTNAGGGSIKGGNGGNGSTGNNGTYATRGGAGGAGIVMSGGTVNNFNSATVTGGNGGNGGSGAFIGDNGGAGGAGIAVSSTTVVNSRTVTGGIGGNGGIGIQAGGAGGAGGAGVSAVGGSVDNSGTITGGKGGNGGPGTAGNGVGGDGGRGGDGIAMSNGTITNSGTIIGGNGGNGGPGNAPPTNGNPGAGGAGIRGFDLTVINSGSIVAGNAGNPGGLANAITFTAGTNILELRSGFSMTGNAVDQTGNGTLRLGGTTNSSFDVSNIGAAAQYQGFSSFEKTGTSTWTLTNTTAALTPWAINQGILAISSDTNLGATSGGVSFNGGTLQFLSSLTLAATRTITLNAGGGSFDTNGNNAQIAGTITGSGSLTKTGAGVLTLFGPSNYLGATNINSGTLQGGTTDAFSANSAHFVASGALLDLNNFNQKIGSLAGSGNVTLGTATLTAGGDNSSTLFSGVMSGNGGFIKQGSGTTTFSGSNTYLGDTNVNAGTLLVNGALTQSNTFVNAGGVFGGTGNVRNVTVNGGIFAPGNGSPGSQMTVNGNLVFNGGIYRVFVDPATVSSAVAGAATLGGATVNALFASGIYLTRQYTILTTTGGLNGSFGALTTTNLPAGFTASVANQGNDVILQLTANLGPTPPGPSGIGGAFSTNQQNLATALNNYFNNGGALPPEFVTLFRLTGDTLKAALDQRTGEPGASASSSTFLAWQQFFNLVFDSFAQNRGGFGGGGSSAFAATDTPSDTVRLAYAAVSPKGDLKGGLVTKAPPAPIYEPRWSVWGGGYGGSAKTDGNTALGSHDTTSRAWGFVVGADHKLASDTMIGFALAGGATSFGVAQGLGGGTSDMFQASLYARQNWGAAYLMGAFGYGWQDFTLKRSITIAANDALQADFNAHTLAGRAETGWRFGSPFAGVTPYGAVQVVSLDLPGYTERATSGSNAFALAYNGNTDTQTRSELGARFDYALPMQTALLTLRGRAAWAHNYSDNNIVNAGFLSLPGTAFTVNGAVPYKDSLLMSAGAELAFRNGFSIAGSFEGEFSGNTESYAGKGSVRYRW